MDMQESVILQHYICSSQYDTSYKGEMGEQLDFEGNNKTVYTTVRKLLHVTIGVQYKTAMTNTFWLTVFSLSSIKLPLHQLPNIWIEILFEFM